MPIRSEKSLQKRLISPLSARILAIMLLPLILLLIGLFSVDKYSRVLIEAELDALQRLLELDPAGTDLLEEGDWASIQFAIE